MSTRGRNQTLKEYRRRKAVLNLELSIGLPGLHGNGEGSSTHVGSQAVEAIEPAPPAPIDVDAIDDEVVLSSPRAFAEAKSRSRRHCVMLDVESGNSVARTSRFPIRNIYKRRRVPPNQAVINCDQYSENSGKPKKGGAGKPSEQPQSILPPPPPPAPEPVFNCPICMGPLVEEMSTKCGHIFCKQCIKTAISAKTQCPTCRKRVTKKDMIRVYLPSTSRD